MQVWYFSLVTCAVSQESGECRWHTNICINNYITTYEDGYNTCIFHFISSSLICHIINRQTVNITSDANSFIQILKRVAKKGMCWFFV